MTFDDYLKILTKYGITFYVMPSEEQIRNTDKDDFEQKAKALTESLKTMKK